MNETETIVNVRNVPQAIKERIRAEAQAGNVSMSEIVVRSLGEFFRVEVTSTGRPTTAPTVGDQLTLRSVPLPLVDALSSFSRRHNWTQSGAAILVMAQRYGIPYAPPRRGGGRGTG